MDSPTRRPAKRLRSETETTKEENVLTPHTLRLLKLIQEGSIEHAHLAATQLSSVAARSSPVVLWDILGRLQEYLTSANWKTRQNASIAMEGVSQLLPVSHQAAFVEEGAASHRTEQDLWLTLEDVQRNLPEILSKGRTLMGSAGTKYDQEEESELLQLDESMQGNKNFQRERTQLQRRILSRRLGFSPILSHVSGKDLDAEIKSEDLEGGQSTESADRAPTSSHSNKIRKANMAKTKAPTTNSIRALLVMEIQQQHGGEQDRKTNHLEISHRSSQSLLATELIFRMFDSSWYVRHGSLMGILALMRAWQVHRHHKDALTEEAKLFGAWPQDILARCICVLALDRFGDYSDTATSTQSGGVVAPVREMAGQVFSVLFLMAPASFQLLALSVLESMVQLVDMDWEVRQGALLALKYAVTLTGRLLSKCEDSVSWPYDLMKRAIGVSTLCLADESDDVQGVAAQLLRVVLSQTPKVVGETCISNVIGPLWKSMHTSRLVSSSIKDMTSLFADLVDRNCDIVLHEISDGTNYWIGFQRILDMFEALLHCEYISIKATVVVALGQISTKISRYLTASKQGLVDMDRSVGVNSYCQMVETSFNLYFTHTLSVDEKDENSDLDHFLSVCRDSWGLLAKAAKEILELDLERRSDLEICLVLGLFGLNAGTQPEGAKSGSDHVVLASYGRRLRVRLDLADAVAQFLIEGWSNTKLKSYAVLEFCLRTGFESPLVSQCEAACLLFEALSTSQESLPGIESLQSILSRCSDPICNSLVYVQNCVRVDIADGSTTFVEVVYKSFSAGVDVILNQPGGVNNTSSSVLSLWRKAAAAHPAQLNTKRVSTDGMRISVCLAGALITNGCRSFPPKLSPMVRALMTSAQNERDDECQLLSSSKMTRLLQSLDSCELPERVAGFQKTKSKVMKNLVAMIEASVEPSCSAASRVLTSLVGGLPSEVTLERVGPFWDSIVQVSCSDDMKVVELGLRVLRVMCIGLQRKTAAARQAIVTFLRVVVGLTCSSPSASIRDIASECTLSLCGVDETTALTNILPTLASFLKDREHDSRRLRACELLGSILSTTSMSACPFVRSLLPLSMALMADPNVECAKASASNFSRLVQLAPLVREGTSLVILEEEDSGKADLVMDHLIHGKSLPPCEIPPSVRNDLTAGGVSLRGYQLEGITWLRFLQTVSLSGALCDSMGLGKTLQALVGVALAHSSVVAENTPKSLIVCPSSVIGHWIREIDTFFPTKTIFRAFALHGPATQKAKLWEDELVRSNLVVTNYATLRSDVKRLANVDWCYCVLDEGHLLKNPKTATARASRQLRARHKLILTGTPVQNHVHEVWATFDFLMPNFLGSSSSFSREFARPITKSQMQGASASNIAEGMEQLKGLHQQVLPFILRREKSEVLSELPPKTVTVIPCEMSDAQGALYREFCAGEQVKRSLRYLRTSLESMNPDTAQAPLGSQVLKSLLYLRLLCTHPTLVKPTKGRNLGNLNTLNTSGKLVALCELLRNAGMDFQNLAAADNDSSWLYLDSESQYDGDEVAEVLQADSDDGRGPMHANMTGSKSKCLIFAQFTHSLDVVEEFLLKRYMPTTQYVRLDGRVPAEKRASVAEAFNTNDSMRIMLLTTRIGGLGLNLTGADTVIFLEHDWNPHADLQAMDRAHRIGQQKTVNVYKLVTTDSIEEEMMKIQDKKMAVSDAIVNTENSTLHSIGTDRLLDIFRFRSEQSSKARGSKNDMEEDLDALVDFYEEEYSSLSLGEFIASFRPAG